ncbi:hypothetical protein [Streptomyces sp. CAU 1734]|uniref:hypothetical protein n=1 Tax=Streptomyces sp. CAU 1734 TaxID=3140360 RepID=UPI00326018CF
MTGHPPAGRPRHTPATRLLAAEALSSLLLSAAGLAALAPGPEEMPEGVQLLGLVTLLSVIAATVHTWRLTLRDGLMPPARPSGLRRRAAAERRLCRMLFLHPAVLIVLLPVPADRVGFWFWLSVLGGVGGAASLGVLFRALRAEGPAGTARHNSPTVPDASVPPQVTDVRVCWADDCRHHRPGHCR